MNAECDLAQALPSQPSLDGRTILLLDAGACASNGYANLLTRLAFVQPTAVRAILAMDEPNGDSVPPNYALSPASSSPLGLRERWTANGFTSSMIFQIMESL